MVAKAATKAGEFFCFHCGKRVALEDSDCKGCGSRFELIVRAFRCPRCARILPVGAVVCPACGLGFKIRNVSGTKQMTKDEEMLVELIDWVKQPEAPVPESESAQVAGQAGAPDIPSTPLKGENDTSSYIAAARQSQESPDTKTVNAGSSRVINRLDEVEVELLRTAERNRRLLSQIRDSRV